MNPWKTNTERIREQNAKIEEFREWLVARKDKYNYPTKPGTQGDWFKAKAVSSTVTLKKFNELFNPDN